MALDKVYGIDISGKQGFQDVSTLAPGGSGGGFYEGTVVFVDPNHPAAVDDADLTTPYLTLSSAMTNAPSGARIYVTAGTYTANITIPDKNLTIVGFGGKANFIGIHVFEIDNLSAATELNLENLIFTGSGASDVVTITTIDNTNFYTLRVENCEFHSANGASRTFYCPTDDGLKGLNFRNTRFTNLTTAANCFVVDTQLGIYLENCFLSGATMSGNPFPGAIFSFLKCDITGPVLLSSGMRTRFLACNFIGTGNTLDFASGSGGVAEFTACVINSTANLFLNTSGVSNTIKLGSNSFLGVTGITPVTGITFTNISLGVTTKTIFLSPKGIEPATVDGNITVGTAEIGSIDYPYALFLPGQDARGFYHFILPNDYSGFGFIARFIWSTPTSSSGGFVTFSLAQLKLSTGGDLNDSLSANVTVNDSSANGTPSTLFVSSPVMLPLTVGSNQYLVLEVARLGSTDTFVQSIWLHGIQIEYISNS